MDIQTGAMLVGAGVAGGTISSVVGGAAIVTFPTLIATGLSPQIGTASSLLALVPCNFLAAAYDRERFPAVDCWLIALMVSSLVGAALGAALLTVTPERVFAACVPALLGFATILFAFAGRISEWIASVAPRRAEPEATRWAGEHRGHGPGVDLWGISAAGSAC